MTEVFKIVPAPTKALWFIGIFALLLVALICLFGYIAYSCRYVQFELSDTELRIRGDLYGRTIPITSIISDRALNLDLTQDKSYSPTWRTNGIGLPGYNSGWFKLKNKEKALVFLTDPHSVVYVPTKEGYSLLMSVTEPERFLDSLRK